MTKKKVEVDVTVYAPFARWRSELLRVEARCFGAQGDTDEELEESVKKALFLAVIHAGDKAMGYCLVHRRWPEAAYVAITAIDPEFQKKGHLGKLIGAVEDELRRIGYTHIERNARVANGYADKIAAHYGDRVEIAYEHGSLIGALRFFRIRL